MLDCIFDGLMDTVKLLPYLLGTFILLELLEHRLNKKNERLLRKNKKFGPIIGAILGALPQCGFSTMAASLFSSRVITIGTVIAVFLSTSDEMLPIMISEKADLKLILFIIGFKVLIGIIVGFIVDLVLRKKEEKNDIHHLCEKDHCECETDGILLSAVKHTIKIALFILLANPKACFA